MLENIEDLQVSRHGPVYPENSIQSCTIRFSRVTQFLLIIIIIINVISSSSNNNRYVHGVMRRGRPKTQWINMIRDNCRELNMTLQEATHLTRDRRVWRATIYERLTHAMASPGPWRRAIIIIIIIIIIIRTLYTSWTQMYSFIRRALNQRANLVYISETLRKKWAIKWTKNKVQMRRKKQ